MRPVTFGKGVGYNRYHYDIRYELYWLWQDSNGKIMAWSVPQPKENQMAKTTNTELFLMEPPYLINAAQP